MNFDDEMIQIRDLPPVKLAALLLAVFLAGAFIGWLV